MENFPILFVGISDWSCINGFDAQVEECGYFMIVVALCQKAHGPVFLRDSETLELLINATHNEKGSRSIDLKNPLRFAIKMHDKAVEDRV